MTLESCQDKKSLLMRRRELSIGDPGAMVYDHFSIADFYNMFVAGENML